MQVTSLAATVAEHILLVSPADTGEGHVACKPAHSVCGCTANRQNKQNIRVNVSSAVLIPKTARETPRRLSKEPARVCSKHTVHCMDCCEAEANAAASIQWS
jgi:hypothetical protein